MLTSFGKTCRKLRIDNNELLLDMANYLGVSAAFLSKVENGKAKPPAEWKDAIAVHYGLSNADYEALCKEIDEARSISTLKIPNVREDDSDLMLAFARKLNGMTDSEKADWRKKFDV